LGKEADPCKTEHEARQKAQKLNGDYKKYPVFFFQSDTSGEKPFEEFYTKEENPVFDKFIELGIIRYTNKRNTAEISQILNDLKTLVDSDTVTKPAIVDILSKILPSFEHIETDRGLDSKM